MISWIYNYFVCEFGYLLLRHWSYDLVKMTSDYCVRVCSLLQTRTNHNLKGVISSHTENEPYTFFIVLFLSIYLKKTWAMYSSWNLQMLYVNLNGCV